MSTTDDSNRDTPEKTLESLKSEFQGLDRQMLDLLNRKLSLAQDLKTRLNADQTGRTLDMVDTEASLRNLKELNAGPLEQGQLDQIFTNIYSVCRSLLRPQRITFLGPEATFTHMAALSVFGRSAEFIPQPSIRDIFLEVEKDACDFGVVPVENSIEGSVNYTLDLFFEFSSNICAEQYLAICHDLLSITGDIKDVKKVYSHPQAIAQCRSWLRKHLPGVVLEECSSTSFAAQKAAADPTSAAIASSEAANLYKLAVIAPKIEDQVKNTTRFLVIGKKSPPLTGKDKTSIMFSAKHVPGALYKVMAPIAHNGINMLKLESRPSKHENWSYFFFMDLEGHMEDPLVLDTVAGMKRLCLYFKFLGSYPRSQAPA